MVSSLESTLLFEHFPDRFPLTDNCPLFQALFPAFDHVDAARPTLSRAHRLAKPSNATRLLSRLPAMG